MITSVNDTEFAEARRARAESAELEFSPSPLGVICTNRETEKTYVTTTTTCTCGDYVYRGSKLGLKCKHSTALALHFLTTGGVL